MNTAPEIYAALRTRMVALATELTQRQAETRVPALPLWTVRDTYAHLAGNVADTLTGNLDGQGTAEWTKVHVSDRAERSLAGICAEWTANADAFDAAMRATPELWGNAFDLWHHEQDVRAALGRATDRDPVHVGFTLDILAPAATAHWPAATPAVRLVADDLGRDWQLGPGPAAATVHGTGYELSRTIAGRRSRAQTEALGWTDPAPHLAHMPAFDFAATDAVETG